MHPAIRIAYGYDQQTSAYTGEVHAYLDPLASVENKPVYTLPANATWTAPPPDKLPDFCRLEYQEGAWQTATDRKALGKEIDRRRAEADAQVNVLDDTVLILTDDAQADPKDEALQAELKQAKAEASAWKRYRLALAKMTAGINDLDVSAMVWPENPTV